MGNILSSLGDTRAAAAQAHEALEAQKQLSKDSAQVWKDFTSDITQLVKDYQAREDSKLEQARAYNSELSKQDMLTFLSDIDLAMKEGHDTASARNIAIQKQQERFDKNKLISSEEAGIKRGGFDKLLNGESYKTKEEWQAYAKEQENKPSFSQKIKSIFSKDKGEGQKGLDSESSVQNLASTAQNKQGANVLASPANGVLSESSATNPAAPLNKSAAQAQNAAPISESSAQNLAAPANANATQASQAKNTQTNQAQATQSITPAEPQNTQNLAAAGQDSFAKQKRIVSASTPAFESRQ